MTNPNLSFLQKSTFNFNTHTTFGIDLRLGFILGYRMINNLLLSKNEEAKEKGAKLSAKLAPIQGKLRLIGVCIGILGNYC